MLYVFDLFTYCRKPLRSVPFSFCHSLFINNYNTFYFDQQYGWIYLDRWSAYSNIGFNSYKDRGEKVVCGSVKHESCGDRPYFMTVSVKLQCNEGVLLTYALLDIGSHRLFCDVKLPEKLGTKGTIKQVSLSTLSSASGLDPISCREIDLTVTGLDSKGSLDLSEVLTVEKTFKGFCCALSWQHQEV